MGRKQIVIAPGPDGKKLVVAEVEFKKGVYTDQNGDQHEEEIMDAIIYDSTTQKTVED